MTKTIRLNDIVAYFSNNQIDVGQEKQVDVSSAELIGETLSVMRTLTPTHVVFNGSVGSMTGKYSMRAKVGEKILFIR